MAAGAAEGISSGSSIREVVRFEWFGEVAEGAESIACLLGEGVAALHVLIWTLSGELSDGRRALPASGAGGIEDAEVRVVKDVMAAIVRRRSASSRKKNRSRSTRLGSPTNRPYTAACSSLRNSTGTRST